MTITSTDNFGHASGSISMSELRDYYGLTGSVSLNANLNGGTNPVPSSLPAAGSELKMSDFRSKNRILKKKGTTEVKTSGVFWSPAQSGCVQYNVYVLGGGGSGGGHSTDSGREKVASGGAAGGVAFRGYSVQDDLTSVTSSFARIQIVLTSGSTSVKVRFQVAPGDISTGSLVAITNLTSQPSAFTSLGVDVTTLNNTSQTVTDADSSNNFVEVNLTLSSGAGGSIALTGDAPGSLTVNGASIAIGAGGAGVSYTAGSGTVISGRNGGTTSFNPTGSGTTISATGGSRGFGGRQGAIDATVTTTLPVGEASSATTIDAWGTCPASLGGSGSGGENNYTGGNGPGLSIGDDASGATGGGSPNLGSSGVNGSTISASGYAKGATTGAPTKPSEWGSDVSVTFQGGAAVQHSSGAAGASDAGNNYGAGSGGSASEVGAGSTGSGSSGAIFVTYYEVNT